KIAGLSAFISLGGGAGGGGDVDMDSGRILEEYMATLEDMRMGPFGSKARKAKEKILQEASNEGI
ncbi:MAG: hypothetical protein J7L93_00660, partial [Thermoplasmata archaeon]|nr:hypothetical protein [Thermoplasmata archaeon]